MAYLDWLNQPTKLGFKKMFYFTSPEHICENLRNARIKISKFDKCNDVFELASFDLRDRGVRKRHREWVKKSSERVGLICFSEDWRNQLMWGHYTNRGTGVCLVIEVEKAKVKKVDYLGQRIAVPENFQFPNFGSKGFRDACSKKSHFWRYEKEHRFFVDLQDVDHVEEDNGLKFLRLNRSIKNPSIKIIGLINGPKPCISESDITKASREKLSYFQCRASFKDFRMVVQQSRKLWK
jgi:hypothetical protein